MLWSLLLSIVVDTAISGIKARSIYACSGESVLLFQNMSKNVFQRDTLLFKNNTFLIETWLNSTAAGEEERVFRDDSGNIWMSSINISDNATYTVQQDIDYNPNNVLEEVTLIVLVAPGKSCRPQTERIGNTLIASLQTGAGCGNPGVTTFWLAHPSLTLQSQEKAKLSPGREAGTYYACIDTPALRCAEGSKSVDFCSTLTIDESNYHIIIAYTVMGFLLLLMIGVTCFLLIHLINMFRVSQPTFATRCPLYVIVWIFRVEHRQPNSLNQRQDGENGQQSLMEESNL